MPEKNLKPKTQNSKPEKLVAKKTIVSKPESGGLTVPVYSLDGKEAGNLELPKELFGAKVNKALLAQAARVYLNNTKAHYSHTKTRSEVRGSTRKVYRQKGTGRARHGAKTAPIYVGGGIALGPKFRKVLLDLPKKMKKAAFVSALSSKAADGEIIAVEGLEKASGKTSQIGKFLSKIGRKSVLLVLEKKREGASRAVRNLQGVDALVAEQVNILEIIKHRTLILTRGAVEKLELRMKRKSSESEGSKVPEVEAIRQKKKKGDEG